MVARTTVLSVRFSGMCAFVSDSPDLSHAQSFTVVHAEGS